MVETRHQRIARKSITFKPISDSLSGPGVWYALGSIAGTASPHNTHSAQRFFNWLLQCPARGLPGCL